MTDDYAKLARLNRPKTRDEMRAAVHELANRGMSDHTIAAVTQLSVEMVRRMLGERTGEPDWISIHQHR